MAAATLSTVAGIGSLLLGDVPEAITRMAKALDTNDSLEKSQSNTNYALDTIEKYRSILTQHEISRLQAAIVRVQIETTEYKSLLLQRSRINWNLVKRLQKERQIRQAAERVLEKSTILKDFTKSTTDKARVKNLGPVNSRSTKNASPESSSSATSGGSPDPEDPEWATISFISAIYREPTLEDLDFDARASAAATVDAESGLGVPLTRLDTGKTAVGVPPAKA